MHTVLRSKTREVVIGPDQPFCIIGERINPTGRKAFAAQLRERDLSQVVLDVNEQVAAGAHVLDVNMGVPLTDEAELLATAVRLVQDTCDLPLCIDSSVVEALEAGLAAYEGKALVNSVTAEDDRLELILPLVKRHGAAVIALANDETGIPATAQERIDLTGKILRVATEEYGIPAEDIVIDPLAMTVGADPTAVNVTLETIRGIRDAYDLNMSLGASNVSFGLPRRPRAQRRVHPAGGPGRAHERDHGRPHRADRGGGAGLGHPARQGRVGRQLDRAPPGGAAARPA